jgi:biopolymer transport protein TolQ
MFKRGHEEINKITDRLSSHDAKSLRDYFESQGIDALERALRKGSLEASTSMEHLLSTLASIATVAPFVGLFGTVWGIIDSFTGLSSGGSSLEAVAPGIAEALVATAVGLFAAIPAVWFYNHFNNQIGRIQSEMESFGQDYLNFVERSVMIKR